MPAQHTANFCLSCGVLRVYFAARPVRETVDQDRLRAALLSSSRNS